MERTLKACHGSGICSMVESDPRDHFARMEMKLGEPSWKFRSCTNVGTILWYGNDKLKKGPTVLSSNYGA